MTLHAVVSLLVLLLAIVALDLALVLVHGRRCRRG